LEAIGVAAAAARRAGLVDVAAWIHAEDLGVRDPRAVVAYRVATPQVAWWCAGLDDRTRERIIDDAAVAVAPLLAEWRPAAVFLRSRSAGQPRPRRLAAAAAAARMSR